MLEETTLGSNLSRKATLLVGEVLQIANKVLPLGLASKLQVCILNIMMNDRLFKTTP